MDTKFNYLICDVDGVIFDRMPMISTALVEAMKSKGVSEALVRDFLRGSLGTPLEIQIRGIMASAGKSIKSDEVKQVIDDFRKAMAAGGDKSAIFPGVKATLDKLKSQGVAIMTSSGSSTWKIEELFEQFKLPHDVLLGSDRILKGEAHIDFFADHFAIARPEFCRRAAFVGDGTADMEIARRNEIFAIGITNSLEENELRQAGAQAVIGSFSELGRFFLKN